MSMTAPHPGTQTAPRQGGQWTGPFGNFFTLLKDAGVAWYEHNVYRYGAALAFYTVVSLAPLVVIGVGLIGLVFGRSAAAQHFLGQVQGLVGPEAAEVVSTILRNAQNQDSGIVATVLGIVAFFAGLTAVFFELKAALNALWGVEPGPNQSLVENVMKMIFSVSLMTVLGFLLLVSLFVSAGFSAMHSTLVEWQPGLALLWYAVNLVVSFGISWLLFALLFKFVPDAVVAFGDVWVGAGSTTILFAVGKVLIGIRF